MERPKERVKLIKKWGRLDPGEYWAKDDGDHYIICPGGGIIWDRGLEFHVPKSYFEGDESEKA